MRSVLRNSVFLYLVCSAVLFFSCQYQRENVPPQVINVNTEVDTESKFVKITYDLIDDGDSELDVWIRVSDDGGETFLVPVEFAYGDVDDEVAPGTERQILWHYDYDNIHPDETGNRFKVKIAADDGYDVNIQELIERVDSLRLKKDLAAIEGIRHYMAGTELLSKTRDFLEKRYISYNWQTVRQEFDFDGHSSENIIGRKPGLDEERKTHILGAHFDSGENTPGAEDNASGVVILLEAMRILSEYNFDHTLKFIGFDAEEEGLIGSRMYVREGIPPFENIEGLINLDQVGYFSYEPGSQRLPDGIDALFPDTYQSIADNDFRGDFVWNIANEFSHELFAEFEESSARYVPGLKIFHFSAPGNAETVSDLRRSDHAPFWDAGYRAILLSAGSGEFRNPNYHLPGDTGETVNYTKMAEITRALVATLAQRAGIRHSGYAVSREFTIPEEIISESEK